MTRYVIIGNSIAGIAAIEGIREMDQKGTITVVSEERSLSYGRPLISYWLEKKIAEGSLEFRPDSFYRRNSVELVLGTRAESIDCRARAVTVSNGRAIEYDRLLVATGARPFVPQVEGLHPGIYHTFMTIEDVRGIALELGDRPSKKKAIVAGAGLTGMKAAEALYNVGVEVSVVDLAERVLMRILDKRGADLVQELLTGKGLQFRLSAALDRVGVSPSGSGYDVILTDGSEQKADLIVVAIGVRPNVELIKEAGGRVGRGVLVDGHLRTDLPDVFAAGDVVETVDLVSGEPGLSQIATNASMQGRIAGINMAGGDQTYPGNLSFNSLPVLGISIVTMGIVDPSERPDAGEYEVRHRLDAAAARYRKVALRHGRLAGGIFVNSPDRTGIVQHLIHTVPAPEVDDEMIERILSGDLGLLDLPDGIRKERLSS